MKPSSHHIKSKVFEVAFNDERESLRFQKSFSDFIRNELMEITEKCLMTYDSPTLKIINKLELNLGDIPYDQYEKVLVERYEEALTHALFNKLEFEGADKEESEDSASGILFMIRHFLLKGYMPWNYDESSWESFNQMFEHATAINKDLLIVELNELLPAVQSRTRLIHQLEEITIQNLVKHIEPTQGQLILDYHKNWINTEKKQGLFGESSKQLSKSFWLFIFNYLYEERGSYFNTKAFLISTLKQIANHFNLSYEEVINQLRIVHKQVAKTRLNDLHYLLEEILTMDNGSFKKQEEVQRENRQEEVFNISDILYYVKNGKWPSSFGDNPSFLEVFYELAEANPKDVILLLEDSKKNLAELDKIVNLIGEQHASRLYAILQPYNYDELVVYENLLKSLVPKTIENGIRGCTITSIIIQTISENATGVFNHQRLLKAIMRKVANHSNTEYGSLIERVFDAIQLDKNRFESSRAGKFMERFFQSELGQEKPEKTRLEVDEIDPLWIEGSIISGRVHPVLEKQGYLSMQDVLKFFASESRKAFESFINLRLNKKKFIVHFVDILDANLFAELRPGCAKREKHWGQLYSAIENTTTSQPLHQKALNRALRVLTLKWIYGSFKPHSDNVEYTLIRLADEFNLDFNLLLKALIQLSEVTKVGEFKDEIIAIANRLGIQTQSGEHLVIEVDRTSLSPEGQKLEKQLAIILSAINGIVNREELELLGFRSADEALRHLMKSHSHLLKERLRSLKTWSQSFLGIGREIPISTYYALLVILNETAGKQIINILRKLEIQLNEGSQAINRFLNITRSLALYRLAEPTFDPTKFTDDFVKLIKHSSPTIYTQVIPVLSKNISMISLPARGNVDEVISNLEAQLYQIDDGRFAMDEKVLSKLINEEYFGQALDNESTIIPYFEESGDVVLDEIYIENAGLVILSSYFGILFERMSLLENGKFLSRDKQEMAVLLLQFLMMHEPPLNEHHLPLNKILCGLDVSHPIRTDIQINKNDRKIINGLIEAVIGYWSAIGHSTIEGFQGSWLWRKGKLEQKEEYWELKVEQNSYDMLLDRLPFTISPIKLSWMEKPLIVEWR